MRATLATRILLAFSSPPRRPAGRSGDHGLALRELIHNVPGFTEMIRDRRILDFGCGIGRQAVALCLAGARAVVGVDINERWLEAARKAALQNGVQHLVEFRAGLRADDRFDVVLSHDSMEHFRDPAAALSQMRAAVVPEGSIVITFSPPWLSPYGAHMRHIIRLPWVHLLFSEHTVMQVRGHYMSDGAIRYEDVEGGLNRMTVGRFERLLADASLQRIWWRLTPVKGLPLVAQVPVLREFCTTRVSTVLRPALHE